jgi:Ca2+-binding EF-hand superfamily protein
LNIQSFIISCKLDRLIEFRKQKIKDKLIREEMMKAFLLFDTGEKGGITLKDLKRAVSDSRENITDMEIYGMMEEADKDSDGIVVVDDFIRYASSSS